MRAAGTEIAHGRNPSSLGGGPPGEGEGRRRKGGFAGACHVYRPLQNNQSKLNENAILLNFIFIFISLLNRHISITHSHQAPIKSGCEDKRLFLCRRKMCSTTRRLTRLSPDFTHPSGQTAESLGPGEGAPAVRARGGCLRGCSHRLPRRDHLLPPALKLAAAEPSVLAPSTSRAGKMSPRGFTARGSREEKCQTTSPRAGTSVYI